MVFGFDSRMGGGLYGAFAIELSVHLLLWVGPHFSDNLTKWCCGLVVKQY